MSLVPRRFQSSGGIVPMIRIVLLAGPAAGVGVEQYLAIIGAGFLAESKINQRPQPSQLFCPETSYSGARP